MIGERSLISGLFRRRSVGAAVPDPVDPFDRPDDATPAEPDPLSLALDEIEAGALAVYAAAGLPAQAGHYRRAPDKEDWTFVAATLTPQERFALALEHPPEQGWRFARLQDLGARSEREDLRAASRLLGDIGRIRASRREVLTQDHLLTAMELGAAWRALRDSQPVGGSRPTLSVPEQSDRPPATARDKRRKPR
ncbi:hypothetical protein SH203_02365 [Brevundimonas sp. SH203]|uniref:hypothetical protein n=1 Tax=Brevundimonas sp. SH203 TaxID=345167 RepID=UPI0009D18209|nr:hypothetical protein [Brevundimonas sp. SH203]GAW41953.1 hypothetical protein SH203_02365 [Brevundimonas sp. SH203]